MHISTWLNQSTDLRKRLTEKPAVVPASPIKKTAGQLKPALVNPATQIERYKNHNERECSSLHSRSLVVILSPCLELQRELQAERAKVRTLPKECDALRESLQLAEKNAALAERARKAAEVRLNSELENVACLRAEQSELRAEVKDSKEAQVLLLKLQRENLGACLLSYKYIS